MGDMQSLCRGVLIVFISHDSVYSFMFCCLHHSFVVLQHSPGSAVEPAMELQRQSLALGRFAMRVPDNGQWACQRRVGRLGGVRTAPQGAVIGCLRVGGGISGTAGLAAAIRAA
jgi:hypothetical protein